MWDCRLIANSPSSLIPSDISKYIAEAKWSKYKKCEHKTIGCVGATRVNPSTWGKGGIPNTKAMQHWSAKISYNCLFRCTAPSIRNDDPSRQHISRSSRSETLSPADTVGSLHKSTVLLNRLSQLHSHSQNLGQCSLSTREVQSTPHKIEQMAKTPKAKLSICTGLIPRAALSRKQHRANAVQCCKCPSVVWNTVAWRLTGLRPPSGSLVSEATLSIWVENIVY
jgi:hypothetical protein